VKHFDLRIALIAVALTVLAACHPAQSVESNAASAIRPVTSIQEVMQALVDPSADAIWEAVSTTITKNGVEEKQPRTDDEWKALRLHAIRVIEGASLLQVSARKVVQDGVKLEDDHVESNAKAPDIAASIASHPAAFAAAAQILQNSAIEVLAAVDARDVPRLSAAGGPLDAACEGCHLSYWYPNQKIPRWQARSVAKK
jgi:hypothetical protein